MEKYSDITVADWITIVRSIEDVVANSYGPQCSQTLITNRTGKAVVTSDGFTILQTLEPSHPGAEFIIKSLKTCHQYTSDGCKTYLMYLASFLHHLVSAIKNGSFIHTSVTKHCPINELIKQAAINARKCIRKVSEVLLPVLHQQLLDHSCQLLSSLLTKCTATNIMHNIVKTTLMPHYSPRLCEHFTELLMNSLPEPSACDVYSKTIQYMVQNFWSLVVKVTNRPYTESTIIPPLLIKCEFAVKCKTLVFGNLGEETCCQVQALVLLGCFDGSDSTGDNNEIFIVTRAGQVLDILHHRRHVVDQFAKLCNKNGICIVLCSECVPVYALDIFREHDISVISFLLKEDINMLEQLSGKLSMCSIMDNIEKINLIELNGIEEMIIGGQRHVHLKIPGDNYNIKHLVLCAPTIGLCDQLSLALYKGLNSLAMCFVANKLLPIYWVEEGNKMCTTRRKPDVQPIGTSDKAHNVINEITETLNDIDLNIPGAMVGGRDDISCHNTKPINKIPKCLYVTEGGGGFEIILSKMFKDIQTTTIEADLRHMCETVAVTMMDVVKKLYDSTQLTPNPRGFLEAKTVLEEKVATGVIWGLNKNGVPCDVADAGILEPLTMKLHVLQCVLSLVEQLLGIDNVVGVQLQRGN